MFLSYVYIRSLSITVSIDVLERTSLWSVKLNLVPMNGLTNVWFKFILQIWSVNSALGFKTAFRGSFQNNQIVCFETAVLIGMMTFIYERENPVSCFFNFCQKDNFYFDIPAFSSESAILFWKNCVYSSVSFVWVS